MRKRRGSRGVAEGSVLPTPPPHEGETIGATIASFSDLDADRLRLQWRNHLGGLAPAHLPRWLLLRMLAFRIQAATLGDLDKATLRLLRSSKDDGGGSPGARPFETRGPTTREGIGLKSGALLVREWKGNLERVMVLEKGFAWNGSTYGSLSQVAKVMTGTNWNGHRFFGLRPARDPRGTFRASRPADAGESARPDEDRSLAVEGDRIERCVAMPNDRGENNIVDSGVIPERNPRTDPDPAGIAP
jgi:hypothetical protein